MLSPVRDRLFASAHFRLKPVLHPIPAGRAPKFQHSDTFQSEFEPCQVPEFRRCIIEPVLRLNIPPAKLQLTIKESKAEQLSGER